MTLDTSTENVKRVTTKLASQTPPSTETQMTTNFTDRVTDAHRLASNLPTEGICTAYRTAFRKFAINPDMAGELAGYYAALEDRLGEARATELVSELENEVCATLGDRA